MILVTKVSGRAVGIPVDSIALVEPDDRGVVGITLAWEGLSGPHVTHDVKESMTKVAGLIRKAWAVRAGSEPSRGSR